MMHSDRNHSHQINPAELPCEAVIFGGTPKMRDIRGKIEGVLATNLPVLIQGESGTGKEVIARFLHVRSKASEAPFVKLNCAAIPAGLLESELFGYEKGSFTGAHGDRRGLIEMAEGGTLFLDEIGDLPPNLQAKLLQILEDGSYSRIGGMETRTAQVRMVCASNTDLKAAVEAGKFREDLYYRLEVVSLWLSALRDRKSDIPDLSRYFLERLSSRFQRPAPTLGAATLQLLQEWTWPGNIRELENWISRAIILGDDVSIGADLRRQVAIRSALGAQVRRTGSLKEVTRRVTSAASTSMILKVLEANRWNRRKTADELRMSYRSLLYKLREAGAPQRRRSHRSSPPAH